MAQFTDQLSAPQGAGAQPVAPVQVPVARQDPATPWVNLAAGLAHVWASGRESREQDAKAEARNQILQDYTTRLNTISDAVNSGQIDRARADTETRSLYAKYSASNPMLIDDFGKINKGMFEYSDLAAVKSESQSVQSAEEERIKAMAAAGYPVYRGMDSRVLEANARAYQATRMADTEFRRLAERQTHASSMATADRQVFEFEQKQQARKLLATLGDSHLDATVANVNSIIEAYRANGDSQTATSNLNKLFISIDSSIAPLVGIDPTSANAYRELFNGIKQYGLDSISGKLNAEASNNLLTDLQNRIKLQTLNSDPNMKTAYGLSYVFAGQLPPTLFSAKAAGAADMWAKLTSQFDGTVTNMVVGTEQADAVFDLAKSQVDALKAGKNPNSDRAIPQIANGVNNILKQISLSASTNVDPRSLARAADFIASPQFLEISKSGLLKPEEVDGARRALEALYEKTAIDAIQSKLSTVIGKTGKGDMEASSQIDIKFNGTSVTIEPKSGAAYTNPMERQTRDQFIRELQPAAKALNQLIRMGAHLNGNTDYQKYWDDNKTILVPMLFGRTGNSETSTTTHAQQLRIGEVVDGYSFMGGDYKDKNNWRKVE